MVNRGLAMVQSVHGNDHDATLAAINSVDFNLPAAALVKGGTHWIVVAGYNPEASADSEVIGGRAIRDILVRNPTVGAANQSIAIKTWMFDELLPNTLCGPFLNKLVMIGAVALFAPPGPSAPSAPAGVRIKRRPVPKRLPKPKRPGRPPKPPKGPKKKKRGKRRG
jgi:hypothetical protein